jgi:hypothetical protein
MAKSKICLLITCLLTVGAFLRCGAPNAIAADALAALLASMPAGSWKASTGNRLQDVAYRGGFGGVGGPLQGIMGDWAGGALDSQRSVLYVFGGGHFPTGYPGNEVYAFDAPTMTWSRVDLPDTHAGWTADDYGGAHGPVHFSLPNGAPPVRHTYDNLNFLPSSNTFVVMGYMYAPQLLPIASQKSSSPGVWSYGAVPTPSIGTLDGGSSTYDPASGHIFIMNSRTYGDIGLMEYDPVGETWAQKRNSGAPQIQFTTAVQPGVQLISAGGGYGRPGNNTFTVAISGPKKGDITLRETTGDQTVQRANAPGFKWYPPANLVVGWASQGSSDRRNIWTLNIATWVYSVIPNTGDVPTAQAGGGTYGRFQYLPNYHCFILANSVNEPVYIYKPNF